MREIELTRGKVAIVDDEDYERVAQFKWSTLKTKTEKCYAVRRFTVAGRVTFVYMHRFVLEGCTAPHVDHRDGDGLNNQKQNLRPSLVFQNIANVQGLRKSNKSGFHGVSWSKVAQKWRAEISVAGKTRVLGNFVERAEAARAYDAAAKERFDEFAYLNFPPLPVAAGMLEGLS